MDNNTYEQVILDDEPIYSVCWNEQIFRFFQEPKKCLNLFGDN